MLMNNDLVSHANMSASVSATWHYTTGIFASLCLLFGSVSNGLVIFVFVRNASLRQPRNILLINLAVTDLGLLLTNNILHAIASFNKQWLFGQLGCNFYAFSGGLCAFTSIATMAAIALTRLMAVIHPFSSLELTTQFILKCIVCSWLYGLIWMIPPLFGWGRFVFEGFGTSCTFDYVSKDVWNRLFLLMLIIGGFLIPLSIIIVSYTFIIKILSKRSYHITCRNSIQLSYRSNTQYLCPNSSLFDEVSRNESFFVSSTNNHRIAGKISHTEARVTRTSLLICGIYCMAWTPYAVMTILSQFGFHYLINVYTTAMISSLTKTAACVNPLIYALSSRTFRGHLYYKP